MDAMSRLLPRASSSGGPFTPSASASLQSCQVHGPKCPRCTGQWLAPVSLACHPEVSKQLGVSVRTHQSSLYSTRSFSQGTLKMSGVPLPRWLAPPMVAVTNSSGLQGCLLQGTVPCHHGWPRGLQVWPAGLHTAGAEAPATTAASSEQQVLSEWPSRELSCYTDGHNP